MSSLEDILVGMANRMKEIERRQSQMVRRGKVENVRKGGNEVQIRLGEDEGGKPILSPWYPISGGNGSAGKTRPAYSKGDHVVLISPHGDVEQAEVYHSNHHRDGPSPSSTAGEHVMHDAGGGRISAQGKAITITGDVTVIGKLIVNGDTMTHNGKNVGSDHKHTGVEVGGSETGAPA